MRTTQFPQAFKINMYSEEEEAHFERSALASKLISRKAAASQNTAGSYIQALRSFASYVLNEYRQELDSFVKDMADGRQDPYDVLSGYAAFLVNSRGPDRKISANTVRYRTILAKKFLRVSGVKSINNDDFKESVTLPRREWADKQPLERKDVIEILNACKDIELKTAILMLASTGGRSIEVFSLRVKDVDLKNDAPSVTFRKEYSKMRQARTRPLTHELAAQLRVWLKHKYRWHRTTVLKDGRQVLEPVTPEARGDDLLFGPWHGDGSQPEPRNIAQRIRVEFGRLLFTIDKAHTDDNGTRRAITLHSFRRFNKTTISNLGYGDYSEWFIGHAQGGLGQTYYKASKKESAELFHKIEPSLTFLDATKIEEYHADISSKLQELADRNNDLRKKDDLSQDAIKTLSDALTDLKEEVRRLKEERQPAAPVMESRNKPRKQIRH